MLAYKQYANIDAQGTLILQNLPFRNHKFVEVVVLINETFPTSDNIDEKLKMMKASFGTIESTTILSDKSLSREQIYGEDGR